MSKNKKKKVVTPRAEPRMWRVNQRAVKFADKKKVASRNACRGKVAY